MSRLRCLGYMYKWSAEKQGRRLALTTRLSNSRRSTVERVGWGCKFGRHISTPSTMKIGVIQPRLIQANCSIWEGPQQGYTPWGLLWGVYSDSIRPTHRLASWDITRDFDLRDVDGVSPVRRSLIWMAQWCLVQDKVWYRGSEFVIYIYKPPTCTHKRKEPTPVRN